MAMKTNIVYTVTVIDLRVHNPLGLRRTPLICTALEDAMYAVKNNIRDLADGASFQYAVIEKSMLNQVRPNLEVNSMKLWYKHNSVTDEFEACAVPSILRNQTGFGIG
jgi:hypothetical protein